MNMKKSKLFAVALVLSFVVMSAKLQARETASTHGSAAINAVFCQSNFGGIVGCALQR